MRSIELFTGAGGLALGTSLAGFRHRAVVEFDHDSCETLRLNKRNKVTHAKDWNIIEGDARKLEYADIGKVDLVAGGVPCQPFSLGGKHRGHEDARDMFPEFARAVAVLRPKVFIVENVKGLLRRAFADYFEYTILRLAHPCVTLRPGAPWREHRALLERLHTAGASTGLDYHVVFQLLNAADYGVPQRRERVFIIGFRSDLRLEWAFPQPTHSEAALLRAKWMTGDYWEQHGINRRRRPLLDERLAARLERRATFFDDGLERWNTVRDAISDLPCLAAGKTSKEDSNHFMNPGARAYAGHTGSPWDEPAKTLKAGDHGVPGGENTLALADGTVRYFSVREAARLQTFPDAYGFAGAWTERMRQVGNAVPVELARIVSESVFAKINSLSTEPALLANPSSIAPRPFSMN